MNSSNARKNEQVSKSQISVVADNTTPGRKRKSKEDRAKEAQSSVECVYDVNPDELKMDYDDYVDIRKKFQPVQKGSGYAASLHNLRLIIRLDRSLSGVWYNDLTGQIEVHGQPPWKHDPTKIQWDQRDYTNLREYISEIYGIDYSRSDIEEYALQLADQHRYNPVQLYLENLPIWDGVCRASRLFVNYCGADDTSYVREVTSLVLLAAVKRAYQPGCKYDYMAVLAGGQGIGKSTLIAKLGGQFADASVSFADFAAPDGGKRLGEKLQGVWIVEVPELSGIKKSDIEAVKAAISATSDRYRSAYGRVAQTHPRSCIFVGTSNDDHPLIDVTGNRRFLIVECDPDKVTKHSGDLVQAEVDQIWAEVMEWYIDNPGVILDLSNESKRTAEMYQNAALDTNNKAGIVQRYLEKKIPNNWDDKDLGARCSYLDGYIEDDPKYEDVLITRTRVCVQEIWVECFGHQPSQLKHADSLEIVRCLKSLGWYSGKKGDHNHPLTARVAQYGPQRMYYRPEVDTINVDFGKNLPEKIAVKTVNPAFADADKQLSKAVNKMANKNNKGSY